MPKLLRKFLGLILLITTIGLATCQSFSKAEPNVQAIDIVRQHPAKSP